MRGRGGEYGRAAHLHPRNPSDAHGPAIYSTLHQRTSKAERGTVNLSCTTISTLQALSLGTANGTPQSVQCVCMLQWQYANKCLRHIAVHILMTRPRGEATYGFFIDMTSRDPGAGTRRDLVEWSRSDQAFLLITNHLYLLPSLL